MDIVSFPGLGLKFEISKIAFYIGNIPVYWYGIIIAIGMLIAIETCANLGKYFGITSNELYSMVVINIPLSIIGARLYYVIFSSNNIIDTYGILGVFNIKQGGLAIYGGIITAILVLYIYCKVVKIKFTAFCDLGLIGMLIGQIIGRLGNFINIEAYGYETTLPWRMKIYQAGINKYIEVHPTFLYEMIWNTIGLIIILYIVFKQLRKFDGQISLIYISWYGLGRFFIEGLRSDSLYIGTFRVSQIVALLSFIISLVLLMILYKKSIRDNDYKNKLYINSRKESRGKKK